MTPKYMQFEHQGNSGRSKFTEVTKLLHNIFVFSEYSTVFLGEPTIQARLLEKYIAGGKLRLKQPEKQNKTDF